MHGADALLLLAQVLGNCTHFSLSMCRFLPCALKPGVSSDPTLSVSVPTESARLDLRHHYWSRRDDKDAWGEITSPSQPKSETG